MLDALLLALTICTCNDRVFVNVGNNQGVPIVNVLKYAKDHGLSFEEARHLVGQQLSANAARDTGSLKIVADERGVKVSSSELQASAARISFDESSRILVLEGTEKAPVTVLKHGRNGDVLRAKRTTWRLNDGRFQVDGARR